jgi:anti-anti-sigma factor
MALPDAVLDEAPATSVRVTAWQTSPEGHTLSCGPNTGESERVGGGAGVSLSIATTKSFSGEVEISPRGEIDVDTAHEVREAVAAVMKDQRPTQINLNLREVSFIDSVGISALVAGFQSAEVGGVKLVVTEPSRFVHRQLWVTGLLGLFGAPEPADGPEPAAADR